MKKGSKILIAIIILLVMLLIGGSAFAYIYLATDILKTDKQLFGKYFSQIIAEEEGFIDSRIKQYNEKKSQMPYENSGEITFEVEYPDESLKTISEKVNDLSIKVSGNVDSTNQKVEQNIKIDYGDDVVLPINYKQDGNKYGIQTDKLSKKFIAIRNEDLDKLIEKLFGDNSLASVENKVEGITETVSTPSEIIEKIQFSEDEKQQIKQIYNPILEQHLTEEKFSSEKTKEHESYTFEISFEEIKNIIIEMLKATKENTLIIDKINELALKVDPTLEKMDITDIDELIKDMNESDVSNIDNLKITLVQNNKKLNQIMIYNEKVKIAIEKKIIENSLTYNINYEMQEEEKVETDNILSLNNSTSRKINSYVKVDYIGLENLNEIQENYEIGFETIEDEETMKYDYKLNFNTKFVETVSIEELDGKVAVFLNDYSEEQLKPFLEQVGNKLLEINKNQMTELGLAEYENPLLYSNPLGMVITSAIMIFNSASEQIEGAGDLSEYQIQVFNDKFVQYEGENVSGTDVNMLVKTVQNSNAVNDENKVKVTLNGNEILENVDSGNKYNVKAVYNLEGYITEMKITVQN